MGDIADMMLDGILDEQTGEFIDDEESHNGGPGYPRTMENDHYNSVKRKDSLAELKIKKIRKELALLIKQKIKNNPKKNENFLVNEARKEINLKYGKGWREKGLT
jgi:hypothetical protein